MHSEESSPQLLSAPVPGTLDGGSPKPQLDRLNRLAMGPNSIAETKEAFDDSNTECSLPTNSLQPPQYSQCLSPNESTISLLSEHTIEKPTLKIEEPSESLVTIPVGKLQRQLIIFCEGLLRERISNDALKDDMESHSARSSEVGVAITRNSARIHNNACSADLLAVLAQSAPSLEWSRQVIIERIWSQIKPWPLVSLDLQLNEVLDPDGLLHSCRKRSELRRLFNTRGRIIEQPQLDASILAWSVENGCRISTDSIRFGLVICSCLAAKQGSIAIGNILKHAYRIGVLKQPLGNESKDYWEHALLVIECSLAMNRTISVGTSFVVVGEEWRLDLWRGSLVQDLLATKKSLSELLGIDIVDLFKVLHLLREKKNLTIERSDMTLRVDDLNIISLRKIGRLKLIWAVVLEDHLRLDLHNMTLSVMWSPLPLAQSLVGVWQSYFLHNPPSEFLDSDSSQQRVRTIGGVEHDLNKELERTWAILFATSKFGKTRSKQYATLTHPPWKEVKSPKWLEELHTGRSVPARDTSYNSILNTALRKDPVSYSQFPHFEARLRQLRHYMDTQKPSNFWQLWNDRRDTLNYYAFWAVIVIGLLTVLLTVATLAVGIAQAVASFRALDMASGPPPPS